ncbi:MAG: hypothetical protein ACK5WZ_09620 [Pseudobdellovibrionaceae bacterium]
MNKVNYWIQKYLVWALPIVVTTMVWGFFQSDLEIRQQGSFALTALWEIMSWVLMIWFLCLLIFMVLLVFRKDTQEATIKHLAGIKERDEREQIVMGMAARRSFVATTGLLIFLFFLSCFTLSVARLTDQTIDGKKSSLSLGFHFTGTDTKTTTDNDGNVMYEHRDIPLSKSAILLIVLVWQVSVFRFKARQELKEI